LTNTTAGNNIRLSLLAEANSEEAGGWYLVPPLAHPREAAAFRRLIEAQRIDLIGPTSAERRARLDVRVPERWISGVKPT